MRDHRHEWTPEELAAAERLTKQLDAEALRVHAAEMQFSNRAERRRAERSARKVVRGDNVVVSSTGQLYSPDRASGTMPPKVPGQHRWMVTAAWPCPDPSAEGPKLMDAENMVACGVGCVDCEVPWSERIQRTKCPAGDEWGQ